MEGILLVIAWAGLFPFLFQSGVNAKTKYGRPSPRLALLAQVRMTAKKLNA
jgi:hypothetical protein